MITAFYISKIIVSTIRYIVYPLFLTLFSVWFYGMDLSFTLILEWWGILSLTAFVACSAGLAMGCLLPMNPRTALIVAQGVFTL